MTDIVCFYADLGRPYLPLLKRMTASAKRVMPDARRVLLTSTPKPELDRLFDLTVPLPMDVTADNLCIERVRATVSWMLVTQDRAILTDPDIEFLRPLEFGDFDVGLLWRPKKPDQPINTGIVLAEPGHPEFWKHYGHIAANLPQALHRWWCDQLAFSLLAGVCHAAGDRLTIDDAKVQLMGDLCCKPDEATTATKAIHFKGRLKGSEWSHIYRSQSDAGKSSPGSAFSTAIVAARNSA